MKTLNSIGCSFSLKVFWLLIMNNGIYIAGMQMQVVVETVCVLLAKAFFHTH